MGLRGDAAEYRHPLDTHLQVLPFPVHSSGPDSPLRYPLELCAEHALKQGSKSLPVLPFKHALEPVTLPSKGKPTPKDLATALTDAFKKARDTASIEKDTSFAMACTATWMLVMPLRPPEAASARHEAWLLLPPPPPCALCGVVLVPTATVGYPETAGIVGEDRPLVSNRAVEEGIPESVGELFKAAEREVRISKRLLDSPLELLAEWAVP